MRPNNLWLVRARPRSVVSWVLAPLSSTKTRREGQMASNCSCQLARIALTSGRFCSAAKSVFFIAQAQFAHPEIDGGGAEGPVHAPAQLSQSGVRLHLDELTKPFHALGVQQGFAPAAIGLRLQRTSL